MGDLHATPARAEAVRRAVVAILSTEVLGEPERLGGGFDNESWVVRVAGSGRVVLRIARPEADPVKVRAAWRAHQLASSAGVPTGRCLHFAEHHLELGGGPVRLVEYVDGLDPRDVLTPGAPTATFFETLGAGLARLHAVRPEGFGSRLDGSAPWFGRWSEYVEWRAGAIARRCIDTGVLAQGEATAVLSAAVELARRVDGVVAPALTHRDIRPANLVAGDDGRLAAIIDWDAAEAWDPMVDLVKPRWWVFGEHPGAEEALWSGYSAGGRPPMLRERLQIVDLLELTNGMANARTEGWDHYEEENRRFLAASRAEFGS